MGFLLVARRLRLADRRSLGYGLPARLFLREAAIAFGIGVVLMGSIVAIMVVLHLRLLRPGVALNAAALVRLAGQGLVRGIAVALIEETFLRGAMWTGIARESGAWLATVLTALIYALTHFVSSYHVPPEQLSWHSGIDMLAGSFGAFARPWDIADAYICLFAVGVVLATVRMRTGNVAASLGLHAGWVWVITFVRETSVADPANPLHGLLSHFDGVVGWLVCGVDGAGGIRPGALLPRAAQAARKHGREPLQALQGVMLFQAVLALLGRQRQQLQQPVAHPLGIIEVARDMGVGRRQLRQHLAQCGDQVRVLRRYRRRRMRRPPAHLSHGQSVRLVPARLEPEYPLTQAQQPQQSI